jgi:2,4-dienoyl-CoA reductase-like NADH-dependent reductase (Old Yellow Enzyme family)
MSQPHLFQPITLRGVTAKNRIVISPMCQYSATDGVMDDWHLVHLGKFALGGAGIVMTEATAVTAEGRITHGDAGLWHDGQTAPMQRIAAFIRANGAVPAIQLAHAGRKGSMQRPWFGNAALNEADRARGDLPWPIVAPSAIPMDEGWLMPHQLGAAELKALREQWRLATLRAVDAGFDVLEVHCAHGYLLHEFLSPLSNRRSDSYGGDRAGRMRYPLEIIETVRAAWPADKPLSVRISSVDGIDGGVDLADSVAFVVEAKARGADLIDCSSGGLMGSATAARVPRGYGFRVPYADAIRTRPQSPPWRSASSCIRSRPRISSRRAMPIWSRSAAKPCSIRTGRCMRSSCLAVRVTRYSRNGRNNTAGGWSAANPACANSTARRCRSGRFDFFSPPRKGEGSKKEATTSHSLRHLIEKSGDALDPAIANHGKVCSLDRAVDAVGAKAPREADVIAIAVRLAEQREAEFGEALLDAGDHGVDAVMTIATHQRIDVFRIAGPVGREDVAAAVRGFFIPQIDVARGNRMGVGQIGSGHGLSPSNGPIGSVGPLSKVDASCSITSQVMNPKF